jgi:hypothetical protein
MTHRKFEEKILIKHEDHQKVKEISREIREFLANHSEIDNSQHIQPGKCGWYNVLTDWRQYKTTYQEEVFIPLWMLCHQSPQ